MTSKLKCPFCGEELYDNRAVSAVASRIDIYLCVNSKCGESDKLIGTEKLWQELIKTKQDLAKAIDVIDTVRQHKRGTAVIRPNDIAAYCDRAIERITHDNSEKPNSVEQKEKQNG